MSETNANNQAAPKLRPVRQYSDNDKATALSIVDLCGGNEQEASRRLGIPPNTIREWLAGRVSDEVRRIRSEKKEALADRLETLAHAYVDSLLKSADDVKPRDAVALGIVVDKLLLLRGQPNSINQSVAADPERRQARILQLVSKVKA